MIYLDDEEINLLFFGEMFKEDFEIFTTSSPKEAIQYLEDNPVDFVLTDQLMPEMTGVEFLEELKSQNVASASKKVMVSGYAKAGEVKKAIEEQLIDEFVSKPWDYDSLVSVIKKLE